MGAICAVGLAPCCGRKARSVACAFTRLRRVVHLPDRGTLIVATDVQGNARDFARIAEVFVEALRETGGSAYLVVTGDLVHGPEIDEDHWPDFLGSFYRGDSRAVLQQAGELQRQFPGRVVYLLGNHEHAHIGGPVVSKFFPDEARRLEEFLGNDGTRWARDWLSTWPFVAVARRAGIVMSHAAPHLTIKGASDIERLNLDFTSDTMTAEEQGALTTLLWARSTSTDRGRAFIEALCPGAKVAIYGHDVVREGAAVEREPLLCVSTSFGCYDGDKLYVRWDLAQRAESAAEVAEKALLPLYPDANPVFRRAKT